jgi:hypothetical protein
MKLWRIVSMLDETLVMGAASLVGLSLVVLVAAFLFCCRLLNRGYYHCLFHRKENERAGMKQGGTNEKSAYYAFKYPDSHRI